MAHGKHQVLAFSHTSIANREMGRLDCDEVLGFYIAVEF